MSDGRSTPVPPNNDSGGGGGDGDGQPALEPGLTSKPPIPPGSGDARVSETFGRATNSGSVATFDDAVELKFQRWFPNSAPVAAPTTAAEVYVESVGIAAGDGRIAAQTYAKSGRGQLDEEHLYSNLSAAIGAASDSRFGGSMSVDLSGALRGASADIGDRGRTRSAAVAKPKNKSKKRIASVTATTAISQRSVKSTRDTAKSKSVAATAVHPVEAAVARNEHHHQEKQPETVTRKDRPKNADRSPVQDYAREDVVSWMSSHLQRPSTPDFGGHTLVSNLSDRTAVCYFLRDRIVTIFKILCDLCVLRMRFLKKNTRRRRSTRSSIFLRNSSLKITTSVVSL